MCQSAVQSSCSGLDHDVWLSRHRHGWWTANILLQAILDSTALQIILCLLSLILCAFQPNTPREVRFPAAERHLGNLFCACRVSTPRDAPIPQYNSASNIECCLSCTTFTRAGTTFSGPIWPKAGTTLGILWSCWGRTTANTVLDGQTLTNAPLCEPWRISGDP